MPVKQQPLYYEVSPTLYGGIDHFAFTYKSEEPLNVGDIVEVPLSQRRGLGVIRRAVEPPAFATKPVGKSIGQSIPEHLVDLAVWLSEYYLASPQSVWQTLLPRGLTKNRRAVKPTVADLPAPAKTVKFNPEQTAAIKLIETGDKTTYLLHGVTGSGKTNVYIELARRQIAAGRSVIVLVPEIALAPQLIKNFEAAFGDIVLSTHSKLTEALRHQVWLRCLESKQPRIVIGPRSALFLPVPNPGLIVIDESHETSFKQEQAPRYQTVTTAAKLAGLLGIKLVLGSATPSLSELYWAEMGKIGLVKLSTRYNNIPPATPKVVDLRDKDQIKRSRFLSEPLIAVLERTLTDHRQSLLFLNRRGSASSLICADCGWVANCPHCGLPLTYHADSNRLICHYCAYQETPPAVCTTCKSANLRYIGGGTKRVESETAKYLPKARLARLDRDSAKPSYINAVHKQLNSGEIDVLIGTQMVAKGLDLPQVDLVGIVSADTMLHIPDFTAGERTFQLLSQVAGRTGRGDRPGEVIIQTYTPDHPVIKAAVSGDFDSFAATELQQRRLLAYPPYVHLLKLSVAAKNTATAQAKANGLAEVLRKIPGINVTGPAPAFRERARGTATWQLIIKAKARARLIEAAKQAGSGWTIDLDPINLL